MKRKLDPADFNSILHSLSLFPEGATIEQINQNLKAPIVIRTLQRRLQKLIKNNQVLIEGQTRSTRYRLKKPEIASSFPLSEKLNKQKIEEIIHLLLML